MLAQVLPELEIQNLVSLAVFLEHLSVSRLPEGKLGCLIGHPEGLQQLFGGFLAFSMLELCEVGRSLI